MDLFPERVRDCADLSKTVMHQNTHLYRLPSLLSIIFCVWLSGELRRHGGVLSHVIISDNKLTLELNKIAEFPGVACRGARM